MWIWVKRLFVGALLVAILAVCCVWALLSAPMFSGWRSANVASVLSEQIGQEVRVTEDVSLRFGWQTQVSARGVEIPSENIEDVMLAKLDVLEFEVDAIEALSGRVNLDNLTVIGLGAQLLTDQNGVTSWSERERIGYAPKPENAQSGQAPKLGILSFLKTKTVTFGEIRLVVFNEQTGFEFDFALDRLLLEQLEGGNALGVTSQGTVNAEAFKIDGYFPDGAPFSASASFSSIGVSLEGTPQPGEEGGGYNADLSIDIASFSDLLEVTKLQGDFDGRGLLNTNVSNTEDGIALTDLSMEAELGNGRSLELNGNIDDLLALGGFDLAIGVQLFPDDARPPPAEEFKDLKLLEATAQIVSQENGIAFDGLLLKTNLFQYGLNEIGPVSIGNIFRTPEGLLSFQDIGLRAGPEESPFLVASGDVRDVLSLQDLNFEGSLAMPAELVLGHLGDDVAEDLGGVEATFAFDDTAGVLSLGRFSAAAVDTDIWSLDFQSEIGDLATLEGLRLQFDIGISDVKEFLEALEREPVDAGAFVLTSELRGADGVIEGRFDIETGPSRASIAATIDDRGNRRAVKASFTSETVRTADIRNAALTLEQIRQISRANTQSVELAETVPLQPLVLEEEKPKLIDLVDGQKILSRTDLEARIEFQNIVGVKGLSTLSSDLTLKEGQGRLGPMDVVYGPGRFRFDAAMDLIDAPHIVSVSGDTRGWDLSDLLAELGIELDADGVVNARFSLSGNRNSLPVFLNSMSGKAEIDMSSGQISTSLMELAGLGIFPWLVSQERRQGYANVTCVVAPVNIRAGRLSFDRVVAETERVQMVARGEVDWNNDTIAIRAEPRPLGKPLSRSAWPFDVTGTLSNPKFKLDIGGSRVRRADGADQMPAERRRCVPDVFQLQ